MNKVLKILLLEDSSTDAEIIQRILEKDNDKYRFHHATDKKSFFKALDEFKPDVIISDNTLPQYNATEALLIARKRYPLVPFILVTGTVSEEFAANIIRLGADDYMLKDRLIRLPAAIETALGKRKAEKEIADYKYALDETADVTITDQRGVIIYANRNFCQISKYQADELLGQDHRIVNSGFHPPEFIRSLWVTIANGKIWHGEFRNKAKDGTIYWQDTTVVPFLDNNGKPYQYLAIRKDITAQKKIREQLFEREKQLELFIKHSPASLAMFDTEMKYIAVSERWKEDYMLGQQLLIGKSHYEIFPRIPQEWKEAHERCLRGDTIKKEEDSFQLSNGQIIWLKWEILPWYKGSGDIGGIIIFTEDITDRKEALEEIKKSNERFRYATMATSDIIWELNFETKELILHEGAKKFYEKGTVIDWGFSKKGMYLFEEDRERVKKSFADVRYDPEKELWDDEYRVWSKEKKILHITNHAIFIRDENGKAIRAIGAITDITEIKKLEIELREQQRKEQLRITATALEAQEKERNIIGQELHDNVNQIIVGTKLLLSMIKNNPEKAIDIIDLSINNLQEAINENRKIAHVYVAPNLESESLVDQLNNLVNNMLEAADLKTHFISSDFDERLLNRQQKINIYRVAQEQCTNIVKYANAKSVRILLETTANTFNMEIVDDGVGMDLSKKITGIGLNNIKGRLSVLEGHIIIDTAPGKGFKLGITIPLKN